MTRLASHSDSTSRSLRALVDMKTGRSHTLRITKRSHTHILLHTSPTSLSRSTEGETRCCAQGNDQLCTSSRAAIHTQPALSTPNSPTCGQPRWTGRRHQRTLSPMPHTPSPLTTRGGPVLLAECVAELLELLARRDNQEMP